MQKQIKKEINPELFRSHSSLAQAPYTENSLVSMNIEKIELKLGDQQQQLEKLTRTVGAIVKQMNEYIKSNQAKMEKVYQNLINLKENDQVVSLELNQKISQFSGRISERKSLDLKVQEMIDRQNSVLKSYEVRMNQFQKIVNDKESQLLSMQMSLNEAKMEIARLKRI